MGIKADRLKKLKTFAKYDGKGYRIIHGNTLEVAQALPSRYVQTIFTSPPYWDLRDYDEHGFDYEWPDGWVGQLGHEPTPEMFIEHNVLIFREYYRVLRNDGTLWIDIADKHITNNKVTGYKPKDLPCIPHRLANALRADGWYLRIDNVWSKNNATPQPVTDRTTKSHEYVFLLSKKAQYFYDRDAIREKTGREASWDEYIQGYGTNTGADSDRYGEGYQKRSPGLTHPMGRNKRSVWNISTRASGFDHSATFPPELPLIGVLAGTSEKGACWECGAPWRRITKETVINDPGWGTGKESDRRDGHCNRWLEKRRDTIGWEPTCECDEKATKPCIVLDPFSGTGTTGEAALLNSRRYLGVEMSKDYIDMSLERLSNVRSGTPDA
jgi:DNA modification methylase